MAPSNSQPDQRPEPPSGAQTEIASGDQRAVVVEVGGGLRSYRVGGLEILDGYQVDQRCTGARGQVLVPWPNRLRDGRYRFADVDHQLPLSEPSRQNAIHGLVRWSNWVLADQASDRVTMSQVLHPRDGYPFTLLMVLDYRLGADGLEVRNTATNLGDQACPYGAGTHPYLSLGTPTIDALVLRAPGSMRMLTDERAIPVGLEPVDGGPYDFRRARVIGDTVLDTGYAELERGPDGRARVELAHPATGSAVALWMDEGYPYLMLFTGDSLEQAERRRRGLGVEPMTCAPNAFQTGDGLRSLEPGQSWSSTWGISPAIR